jgi:DNA-directed RNA polymerase II subunit RPB1
MIHNGNIMGSLVFREMNCFLSQSYKTKAEMQCLMSTSAQFVNGADSRLTLSIKQDAMVGGYLFTLGTVKISKNTFMDTCCTAEWDMEYIINKINHIKETHKWLGMLTIEEDRLKTKLNNLITNVTDLRNKLKNIKINYPKIVTKKTPLTIEEQKIKNQYILTRTQIQEYKQKIEILNDETYITNLATDNLLYTGRGILSMLFPDDFEYICNNKMSPDGKPLTIIRGVITCGTLNKVAIGSNSGSLIHHLYKDYGGSFACDFVTYYQRFINILLGHSGFSVGLEDCMPKHSNLIAESEQNKCFLQAKTVMETELDLEERESKILNLLNEATNIGDRVAKESLENKSYQNNVLSLIISGAKGSMFNAVHMTSCIGQQNLEGKRVLKNYGGRTLPCYQPTIGSQFEPDIIHENKVLTDIEKMSLLFQSRGFILSSFYKGLSAPELFFLAAGGREGLIDVACKTAKCGYLNRKLLKLMEDLKIGYVGGNVINSRNNIVQFCYGEDNLSSAELIRTDHFGYQSSDVQHICSMLNREYEYNKYEETLPIEERQRKREEIIVEKKEEFEDSY